MSFKISKNKIHVYSASREITEPGALWNQGQLLILLLISHRGAMPPRCFCRADWLSGMPAQLTAVMDGAPAPAPPGCSEITYTHVELYHSVCLHWTHLLPTPPTPWRDFNHQQSLFWFANLFIFVSAIQEAKQLHCWESVTRAEFDMQVGSFAVCKARCLTSSIA